VQTIFDLAEGWLLMGAVDMPAIVWPGAIDMPAIVWPGAIDMPAIVWPGAIDMPAIVWPAIEVAAPAGATEAASLPAAQPVAVSATAQRPMASWRVFIGMLDSVEGLSEAAWAQAGWLDTSVAKATMLLS
jgi:hypothetical protein